MKFHFIFLFIFFSCLSVKADNYYVSNSGSNGENGSASDPWETLQYAADNIDEGDTVFVLGGNYEGFHMIESGSKNSPIVFKASHGAVITSRNQTTQDAINLEGADYIVIDGFTITNDGGTIERAGIRSVANTGVVIVNNSISNMGRWGIFTGFSESVTIENNSCSFSQEEHGIYHSNSADNPLIRKNICFSNNGCGIHMNGDVSMGGDGIISNAKVESNIIYDNGKGGGSGINCDGVQNSIFRNNLIYNNHASGISLYHIDGAEGAKNNILVNNTIVMPSDGRWAININAESTGTTIYNNILFSDHSFRGGLCIDAGSISGTISDYNVVVDRFSLDQGDTRITMEEWQNETGQDLHSYVSNPDLNFVDQESNDYSLIEECDAVNHGTSVHAPWFDLEGNYRPTGGGYDIGAYEFTGFTDIYTPFTVEKNLIIYPNPATDHFMVETDKPINKIEIISTDGKIIKTYGTLDLNSVEIPVAGLARGKLIVRVLTVDQLFTSYLIVK